VELLNILSWISYTVPYDSIPGRLAPLVTILLAMINTVMRAVGESPDKSHFTPLMGFCFVNQIQVENQNKHILTLRIFFQLHTFPTGLIISKIFDSC
jgi:hypothetical protein